MIMNITFHPLSQVHYPLLLKWLETPHVKSWWDSDVRWTPELIRKKYDRYVSSKHTLDKSLYSFIILYEEIPIGYIQYYTLPPSESKNLPEDCVGMDWYIGEQDYIGKGIGPRILDVFLMRHVFAHFSAVVVDPDARNTNAIKVYENAGFKTIKSTSSQTWMVRTLFNDVSSLAHQ